MQDYRKQSETQFQGIKSKKEVGEKWSYIIRAQHATEKFIYVFLFF